MAVRRPPPPPAQRTAKQPYARLRLLLAPASPGAQSTLVARLTPKLLTVADSDAPSRLRRALCSGVDD
jgi:hypothetical protein